MKRIINILIIVFGVSFVILATSGTYSFYCPFKKFLHIRCPGCGLSRSFIAIFNLNFKDAFYYNILGIPLFIGMIVIIILLVYDIITNKLSAVILVDKILKKYYVAIIFAVILSMIINNIRGI